MPNAKFKTGVKSTVDTGSASSIPVTKSKVVAPRNPKLILEDDEDDKVLRHCCNIINVVRRPLTNQSLLEKW